jgi:hypothetical protein
MKRSLLKSAHYKVVREVYYRDDQVSGKLPTKRLSFVS